MTLFVTGALAGLLMGFVLERGQLCFHATWSGLLAREYGLARAWLLGVMIGVVGLATIYSLDVWPQLNEGLAFRPARNIAGGLIIGAGMVIAITCASGLFFKLGAGMLGALVGVAGWALGDGWVGAPVRDRISDDTVLDSGASATIPGWLGVNRWFIVVPVVALVVALLFARRGATRDRPGREWQWAWPLAGMALGVVLVAGWVLAGVGNGAFGPSTVGTVSRWVDGDPSWWIIGFVAFIVAGSNIAARTAGVTWIRGETLPRYVGLGVGGLLLGVGGQVGGGCNLGHGLSGVAQLNVSSWVVVAAVIVGIATTRAVWKAVAHSLPRPAEWAPATSEQH